MPTSSHNLSFSKEESGKTASSALGIYVTAGIGALILHAAFFGLLAGNFFSPPPLPQEGNEGFLEVSLENSSPGEEGAKPELLPKDTPMDFRDFPQDIPEEATSLPEPEANPPEDFAEPIPDIIVPDDAPSVSLDRNLHSILSSINTSIPKPTTPSSPSGRSKPVSHTSGNSGASSAGAGDESSSSGLVRPRYKSSSLPPYPSSARQNGYEGTVRLTISLDENGNPVNVSVRNSSGHSELDNAALNHVRNYWKFHPAEREGKAVPWTVIVPVVFNLKNS